eukprot:s1205_g15.t1
MDCMREFAPGPYHDPSAQINVLRVGNQADDAICSYLYDVISSQQQNVNSVIFVGAAVLGGSSWLNRQIDKNFEKVEFRTDYLWREVPPEAQIHQTKQYKMLSKDENWASVKIDGCTHGQRLIVPGPGGIHAMEYCKVEWEYFAANVKLRPKLSDRLLNALQFRAPSDGRLVSMPANIPKGRIDRVVVNLDGAGDGFAEPNETKGCARIQCREPMSSCSQEDELVKKLKSACRGDLRTPVLFVVSLLRSGERPKKVEGSSVGGDSFPGGKYKRFRSVLKSLKRLLRKCAEFSNIYFALEMPSSYSYWSWPELHAFISSSKVRKAKVADHVDATGHSLITYAALFMLMPGWEEHVRVRLGKYDSFGEH